MVRSLSGKQLFSLLLILLFAPAILNAQIKDGSIVFTWGDSYELPKKHSDLGFIGNEIEGYVQIGHAPHRSLSFQKFSNALKLTSENTVDLKDMPDDYQNVAFTKIKDRYYWIFCTWERADERERLFAQEIDVKNTKLIGKAKQLCATSKLTGTAMGTALWGISIGITDKWNLYYSLDSNKLLVQYRKRPEQRQDSKNKDIIGFQVFDEELNKIWGKEIRMPYTEARMDNEDYDIDKDGNVYTLAKVYATEKGDKKKPNYHMEILKWTKDNNEVTKIPFKFTDQFVTAARMTKGFDGSLLVVGFYSKKKPGVAYSGFNRVGVHSSADGVFLLQLDEQSGELSNVKKGIYEFPQQVLSEFESARTKRRNEKKDDDDNLEAQNMVLRNIVVNSDGSIQVYGEEAYKIITTTYNGRSRNTTVDYYYNDILGMNIGADGELKWVTKVPKLQHGINSGLAGMSFKLFPHNNNQYIFFMDNMKNIDLPVDEAPKQHVDGRGGVLMVVKIDENGKKSKAKIFDVREEDKNLIVSNFSTVGIDKIVARAFHRRDSQPVFITFK
ncbi:MAG TPA: hypothetical protein PL009_01750 [Flavipsychrobacter sp.]|nr:hypothetical protein [Flavipsychrobacter sp.]